MSRSSMSCYVQRMLCGCSSAELDSKRMWIVAGPDTAGGMSLPARVLRH